MSTSGRQQSCKHNSIVTALADLHAYVVRPFSEWSSRSDGGCFDAVNARSCPVAAQRVYHPETTSGIVRGRCASPCTCCVDRMQRAAQVGSNFTDEQPLSFVLLASHTLKSRDGGDN